MADECDLDNVTIMFDACNEVFEDCPTEEVIYVLGMLIAHAIKEHAFNKNPALTFMVLREIVDVELIVQ